MNICRVVGFFSLFAIAAAASAQIVNCSSNDGHRRNCPANTSNGVRMEREISGSACTAGYSWGYESNSIWVDHGCRADFALNVGAIPQSSSQDAMRSCKNAVSARQPNVPLAYIQVDSPRVNGGSLLANFRVSPPNGARSSGSCDVFQNGRVNVTFNSNPGRPSGGNAASGNFNNGSPQNALLLCKNEAANRLRNVPMAYISVYRGSDEGDGSYMINFHSQPPGGPNSSGFCIVSRGGQLKHFEFDPGSGGNSGGGSSGGQSAQDAMRSCKNEISRREPNVPLAYIQVDQARVNGGSMMANFRVSPPNGPRSSGSCDVFKNGKVNVTYNR